MTTKDRIRRIRDLTHELARETQALNRDIALQSGDYSCHRPRIAAIQEAVCLHYDLPLVAMVSKIRTNRYAHPRQLAIFFCRELTHYSHDEIATCFGNRDHGTALHAIRAVQERIATEKAFAQDVDELRFEILGKFGSMDMPLFRAEVKAS